MAKSNYQYIVQNDRTEEQKPNKEINLIHSIEFELGKQRKFWKLTRKRLKLEKLSPTTEWQKYIIKRWGFRKLIKLNSSAEYATRGDSIYPSAKPDCLHTNEPLLMVAKFSKLLFLVLLSKDGQIKKRSDRKSIRNL